MAERQPLPKWRKVLGVVILLLVVGPLLFSMFYSAMTHTTFADAFANVAFYYPYLGIFVVIALAIGIGDLVRRRGK